MMKSDYKVVDRSRLSPERCQILLDSVLEGSLDGIVSVDHDGRILAFNPAAERLFGITRAEALGTCVDTLVALAADAPLAFLQCASSDSGECCEGEGRRPGGARFPITLNVSRIETEPPLYTLCIRDQTARRRTEVDRVVSETRLRALSGSLYAGVLLEDENRRTVLANQRFCDQWTIPAPPEVLTGMDGCDSARQMSALFADPAAFMERVERLVAEGKEAVCEELALADGRTLERDFVPVWSQGALRGYVWKFRDVTERKRIERARGADAQLMAALTEASLSFVQDADLHKTLNLLLDRLLTLTGSEYGFLAEVLVDSNGAPYIQCPAITDIAWDNDSRALRDERAPDLIFRKLDNIFGAVVTSREPVIANDPAHDPRRAGLPPGHPPLSHFLGLPIFHGEELIGMVGIANRPGGYDEAVIAYLRPFLAACSNIIAAYRHEQLRLRAEQERSAALEQLSEAHRFIGRINDTAPMLIYLFDLQDQSDLYASRSIAEMLGYDAAQQAELGDRTLATLIHPDDLRDIRVRFRILRLQESDDAKVQEFDCRLRRADGSWRVFHNRYTVFQRDETGHPRQILVAAVDVTERNQAEERLHARTQELRRSNQALQDFASIASHDLQEPLRKIQAFGGRLKAREAANLAPDSLDYLERMLGASGRMQTLIDDLLAYSRVTSKAQPFCQVNLNRLVGDVLSDLEGRLLQSAGAVTVAALPEIEADAVQMRQLFQNLIGNALKFARPGVPPVVQVCAELTDDGAGVRVSVSHNGIGFEPQYAERIFEIFERLHGRGEYEGTGMGLAICRRIVDRHGGVIRAESAPGSGARFEITLPTRHEKDEIVP